MNLIRATLTTLSVAALAACASAPPSIEGEAESTGEIASEFASPGDIQHACLHATFGPFKTVTSNWNYETATVNINKAHTAHNVQMALRKGSRHGVVVYRPAETGEHAFFINPDVPLTLRNASTDAVVPVVSQQSITTAQCSILKAAITYDLTAGQDYKLTYGPTTASTVLTVIEHLHEH
jgi:hypothetical protein